MPAFTFEKISPETTVPSAGATIRPAPTKQLSAKRSRGLIVQMLDRFAIARIKREARGADTTLPRDVPLSD